MVMQSASVKRFSVSPLQFFGGPKNKEKQLQTNGFQIPPIIFLFWTPPPIFFVLFFQPPQKKYIYLKKCLGNGDVIRIGRDIECLQCEGFFLVMLQHEFFQDFFMTKISYTFLLLSQTFEITKKCNHANFANFVHPKFPSIFCFVREKKKVFWSLLSLLSLLTVHTVPTITTVTTVTYVTTIANVTTVTITTVGRKIGRQVSRSSHFFTKVLQKTDRQLDLQGCSRQLIQKNVTCDMGHMTCDKWCGVNILSKFYLSSSYGLGKTVF